MKPGQVELNEFEVAILKGVAIDCPSLLPLIDNLHVLSREFTGVGSYTNFSSEESSPDLEGKTIGLGLHILMPNVPSGMGAVLFCKNNTPDFLEIYTYGSEPWDGVYNGYSLDENV